MKNIIILLALSFACSNTFAQLGTTLPIRDNNNVTRIIITKVHGDTITMLEHIKFGEAPEFIGSYYKKDYPSLTEQDRVTFVWNGDDIRLAILRETENFWFYHVLNNLTGEEENVLSLMKIEGYDGVRDRNEFYFPKFFSQVEYFDKKDKK